MSLVLIVKYGSSVETWHLNGIKTVDIITTVLGGSYIRQYKMVSS